ncbi:MAG TPA: TIM barrel protein [Bauldia sp.]|nr:TIM barrel protein [Bauldia sp.]
MQMISLSPLSVLPVGPVEQIEAAATAGFDMVGMRLCPVSPTDPRIMEDASLKRGIKRALAATGRIVLDIEVFRLSPKLDVDALVPMMEFGADLGARHMLCTFPLPSEGTVADEDATVERLVALCDRAEQFGICPMLEFMKFRLMPTLADAQRVARKAGHRNLGICVDSLHLARSGGTVADVRNVDPTLLRYCQISDAPAASPGDEGLPREARYRRLSPGEGGLPLAELIRALPAGIPLSIEVPDADSAGEPAVERAHRLADDTRALLQRAAA